MQKISAGKFHVEPPSRFTPLDHLGGAAGYLYVFAPAGSRTVNTEPLPISLVTVTSPPIMRASLRVMARPRPVPPKLCAVEASAWVNSLNSFACCSAVMPMPVTDDVRIKGHSRCGGDDYDKGIKSIQTRRCAREQRIGLS